MEKSLRITRLSDLLKPKKCQTLTLTASRLSNLSQSAIDRVLTKKILIPSNYTTTNTKMTYQINQIGLSQALLNKFRMNMLKKTDRIIRDLAFTGLIFSTAMRTSSRLKERSTHWPRLTRITPSALFKNMIKLLHSALNDRANLL